MAGDQMATQLVTQSQRSFDVNMAAHLEFSKVSAAKRFRHSIESQLLLVSLYNGQATPIDRHAVADLAGLDQISDIDHKPHSRPLRREPSHRSLSLDQSSKHL